MAKMRERSATSGETEHDYTECRYASDAWSDFRRVVIKAEVVRLDGRVARDNPRFVVTNLKRSARHVYEDVYCQRGEVENRIKELIDGLAIDRTSCTSFLANQARVLLTCAAYALMQEMRLAARARRWRAPGDDAARASGQAGRVGAGEHAPDRAASAGHRAVAPGLVRGGEGAGREAGLTPGPLPNRRLAARMTKDMRAVWAWAIRRLRAPKVRQGGAQKRKSVRPDPRGTARSTKRLRNPSDLHHAEARDRR